VDRGRRALGEDGEGDEEDEELAWDEEVTQVDVVELHGRDAGGKGLKKEEEEEWEVCRVQEVAEDDYELI
jgi:hypothetical protein